MIDRGRQHLRYYGHALDPRDSVKEKSKTKVDRQKETGSMTG